MELMLALTISWLVAAWIANRSCERWFCGLTVASSISCLVMFIWATILDLTSETQTLRGVFFAAAGVVFSPVPGLLGVLIVLRKRRLREAASEES